MSITPTQRTLKYLRDLGFTAAVTERWNNYAHIRQDMFGFVDVLAFDDERVVAVQTTSHGNHATRVTKIRLSEPAQRWLRPDLNREIWVISWGKKALTRGARLLWTPRVDALKPIAIDLITTEQEEEDLSNLPSSPQL